MNTVPNSATGSKTEDFKSKLKKYKKKVNFFQIFRICVQLFFIIAAPSAWSSGFTGIKTAAAKIGSGDIPAMSSFLMITILLLVFTFLLGRFFCGWACAFGTYNDFVRGIAKKLGRKKSIKLGEKNKWAKLAKYVILVLILALCLTGNMSFISGKSPWDVFSMILAFRLSFKGYAVGIVILVLITAGAVFIDRFFCRFLCPLGAVFSLVSRIPVLALKKERTDCGKCKACTMTCIAEIPLNETDIVHSGECFRCMRCADICPRKNVHQSLFTKIRLNKYVISLVQAAALFILLYLLGATKF